QFSQRLQLRRTLAAGCPVEIVVMQDDDGVVGGKLGVEFDPLRAFGGGRAKTLQGILRSVFGGAAMADDSGQLHVSQVSRRNISRTVVVATIRPTDPGCAA